MTETVRNSKHTILTILIGAVFVLAGVSLFQTVLPIRAGLEAFSTKLVGFLGTAYFCGFIAGCLFGPWLVRIVGHIRAFSGVAALTAALTLIFPVFPNVYLWIVLRLLCGLTLAIAFMVIESWLNDQSDNSNRGRILSAYIIVANVATMAGQLMVNVADPAGPILFGIVTILLCLAVVPLALTPTAEPSPIPTARLELGWLFSTSPTGTVGCFLVGAVEGAFWTLGPVFGQLRGMSVFEVTVIMAAFVLGGTLSQWPLGRWSDLVDRRFVLLPTAAACVCTGLIIALWTPSTFAGVFALAALHGALMVPLYALCLAHANDSIPSEKLVQTSSGLLLIYSIGAAAGPFLAAFAVDLAGAGGLFLFISASLAVLVLFIGARLVFGPQRIITHRGPFAPLVKTSQSVFELEVDDEIEAASAKGEER